MISAVQLSNHPNRIGISIEQLLKQNLHYKQENLLKVESTFKFSETNTIEIINCINKLESFNQINEKVAFLKGQGHDIRMP